MYGLATGVSHIGEQLPEAVYAVLSGLNAATVGVIVLAAVQLSERAITDRFSRFLVFFGAAAGMLYTTIWYFPVLLVVAGVATVTYDMKWLHKPVLGLAYLLRFRK
jgi:chromate transport protein ChrA